MVHIALFPGHRSKVARLSGLMPGVTSSHERSIGCARVVFEYLGRTLICTRHYARAACSSRRKRR
jgi:hypothetical protein